MCTRCAKMITLIVLAALIAGCGSSVTPTSIPATDAVVSPTVAPVPTKESLAEDLSEEETATLNSLEQVDDYPLYTMHYYGAYEQRLSAATETLSKWACSLFAALGDADNIELLYKICVMCENYAAAH